MSRTLGEAASRLGVAGRLREKHIRMPHLPAGGLTLSKVGTLQYVATRPKSSTTRRTSLLYKRNASLQGVMAVVGRSPMSKELMESYKHTKRVGPYLLGRTIGEGSFAKVKEAMHVLIGEKVAIKIIDKKVAREDPYLHKTLRREAGLLQHLGHAHIVRLLEVMETDNNLYLVLELCGGGPLLDRVCQRGGLEEGLARAYIKQVASAVYHMHQMGVMHRDLKVENLLLDDNDKIKIIDFGLSNFIGNLEKETAIRDAKKREKESSSRKQADLRASRRQSQAAGGGGGGGENKTFNRTRLPSDNTNKRKTRGASFREESGQEAACRERAGLQRKDSKERHRHRSDAKQNGGRTPRGNANPSKDDEVKGEENFTDAKERRKTMLRNRVPGADAFGTRDFAGTLCGSPAYAAPEIIAKKRYGPKVDVWSIGVNTFAILTGTLPFIVEPFNLRQLLNKIQKGEIGPLPSGLSADCKNFIHYLLEPDPEKRPTVYDVICHPWLAGVFEPLRSLSPTSYTPTPTPPSTPCSSASGRRVSRMLLDHDIIKYIRDTLGIKSTHVSESVLAGRADEYSAIYHLLAQQREREDVPKIAKRLRENWDAFRACSRQDDDVEPGDNECGKTVEDDGAKKLGEVDDIDVQSNVAEATALQIAGKKNGSFHFKMAMVIEEEAERVAKATADGSSSRSPVSNGDIYREVLKEDELEGFSSTSPTKYTSSKEGPRVGSHSSQPRQCVPGNQSCLNDSRVSAASGNPWLLILGRERTTSTIRSSDISGSDTRADGKDAHLAGVTTACFKGDPTQRKDDRLRRTDMYSFPGRGPDSRQEGIGHMTAKRYGSGGNTTGRVSLTSGRAVHLTFQQSTDPTVTTFANHFQQNHVTDRFMRRSNLKNSIQNVMGRTFWGQGGRFEGPKAVTFRTRRDRSQREIYDTKRSEAMDNKNVANMIGAQVAKTARVANGDGNRDRTNEQAVNVNRTIRKTSAVPPKLTVIRKRRASIQTKRKSFGKTPVTPSRKPVKPAKGKNPEASGRSAAKTLVTMAGRPSTASLQDVRNKLEQAVVTVGNTCSRTKTNHVDINGVKDAGDLTTFPRRFSTSDEGYDTNHSIEGDSASNKRLPEIAPPIVRHSSRRSSVDVKMSVSKTMKNLMLEKAH